MSSKSSSSSRQSSPRAMPVETIITRFKSAQLKRQLREMDRSMTKVTELLKNPLKPKVKKKVPSNKVQRSSSVTSVKDGEEGKRSKKNRTNDSEKDAADDECCSLKLKRHVVSSKVRLKPKQELKVIGRTNKRKRTVPSKGSFPEDNHELSVDSDSLSRDVSPNAKRSKPVTQDMTMDEMIQLIEDSGSLDDEDLLEILTCPSPVWWEDPPNGYIEDALFTRPRSSAEMYPSIRSQLQENMEERQRSSTPNVLSRRERVNGKRATKNVETKKKEADESCGSNNDIALEITLSKCDEKFIKKRSKLESVLGNLKNKTFKNNESVKIKDRDISNAGGNVCNKVSVIKNICSDRSIKVDELGNGQSNLKVNKQKAVSMEFLSDSTDDERLTDISLQDDNFLNDLENIDIPVQHNPNQTSKEERESLKLLANKDAAVETDNQQANVKNCKTSDWFLNKCKSIDPTYSNKESSLIEDYFEMKLLEEDDNIVNKEQNECSKYEPGAVPNKPIKCTNDCKQSESNLTSSVIKFKNSDNTSINVFKIESVVPKNLPPLKNSDVRKTNSGSVPEILPPLIRNPGVIHLNSESTSNMNRKSIETPESYSNLMVQDNMDSISDTNICFLNEDEEDFSVEKKKDNNNELGRTVGSVIKPNNIINTKFGSHDLSYTGNEDVYRNEIKFNNNNNRYIPKNKKLYFAQDIHFYRNMKNMENELEFQSLTITKVNDNNCCNVEGNNLDDITMKKNDLSIINYEKENTKNEDLNTVESETCLNQANSTTCNEIIKFEKENADCITVYKIVSDDSGTEEPKNELLNEKNKNNGVQDVLDSKESNCDQKSDDSTEKSDSNRDKMIFYFKKCKNLYWKHKNLDKIDDKKLSTEKDDVLVRKTDVIDTKVTKDKEDTDNTKNKFNNTSIPVGSKVKTLFGRKQESNKKVNHNNNLTKNNKKEQKCIIVSNTKQMRYCMKCSSIFDTAQCNYCYRKGGTEKKNLCATDYLLKMEQCFVCDVCRYKALSKESLERHISTSHCHDSKHR